MTIQGKKREQLVEEFNVQIYSSGRIDWDRLDAIIDKQASKHSGLKNLLKYRLAREAASSHPVAA